MRGPRLPRRTAHELHGRRAVRRLLEPRQPAAVLLTRRRLCRYRPRAAIRPRCGHRQRPRAASPPRRLSRVAFPHGRSGARGSAGADLDLLADRWQRDEGRTRRVSIGTTSTRRPPARRPPDSPAHRSAHEQTPDYFGAKIHLHYHRADARTDEPAPLLAVTPLRSARRHGAFAGSTATGSCWIASPLTSSAAVHVADARGRHAEGRSGGPMTSSGASRADRPGCTAIAGRQVDRVRQRPRRLGPPLCRALGGGEPVQLTKGALKRGGPRGRPTAPASPSTPT